MSSHRHHHPSELVGPRDHLHPRLPPLDKPRVGRLRPEDEQQRQGRGCQLVRQRRRLEKGEEFREPGEGDGGVVEGEGGGDGGEREDRWDKGEDDPGGDAGEEMAEVTAGAAVGVPVVGGVEGAALAHAALLDFISPLGDPAEGRGRGVGRLRTEDGKEEEFGGKRRG